MGSVCGLMDLGCVGGRKGVVPKAFHNWRAKICRVGGAISYSPSF